MTAKVSADTIEEVRYYLDNFATDEGRPDDEKVLALCATAEAVLKGREALWQTVKYGEVMSVAHADRLRAILDTLEGGAS